MAPGTAIRLAPSTMEVPSTCGTETAAPTGSEAGESTTGSAGARAAGAAVAAVISRDRMGRCSQIPPP